MQGECCCGAIIAHAGTYGHAAAIIHHYADRVPRQAMLLAVAASLGMWVRGLPSHVRISARIERHQRNWLVVAGPECMHCAFTVSSRSFADVSLFYHVIYVRVSLRMHWVTLLRQGRML